MEYVKAKVKPVQVETIEKLLQYNISVQSYSVDTQVSVQEFCNGFTVRNIGASLLTVMGDPLTAGQSKDMGGNRGEIFVGRIDIKFSGAGANLCLISQKCYLNIPRNNEAIL